MEGNGRKESKAVNAERKEGRKEGRKGVRKEGYERKEGQKSVFTAECTKFSRQACWYTKI